MVDTTEVRPGLVIFRRTDVKHDNWYCRIKIPEKDAYKFISLKTALEVEARERARDAAIRVEVKLELGHPVFDKSFAEVAAEFSAFQKERAEAGHITLSRWRSIESHIKSQLNPYMGARQITLVGEALWRAYPIARKRTGKGNGREVVSDATIRGEMTTLRAIMAYAVEKKLITNLSAFKATPGLKKVSREEFTPSEYRKLHTFARTKWVTKALNTHVGWYRSMTYWFILVMTNTGMRPPEARNLRWRDVAIRSDKKGRRFVTMNVRGKGKFRTLVASMKVAKYLDEIREISPAVGPDDPVFCTHDGRVAVSLYNSPLGHLFDKSGLLFSASGSRRSTYCFRHTYATFRLTEGVDSLFLAKQMGTSVKMIEDHYGHVSPDKNAERILQGLPGWGAASDAAVATFAEVDDASPTQDGASAKPERKRREKAGRVRPQRQASAEITASSARPEASSPRRAKRKRKSLSAH